MLKMQEQAVKLFFDGLTLYVPTTKTSAQTHFDYEGENNRYILMLFNHTEKSALPAKNRQFLEKILLAVKMTFKDVAMMNIAGTQPTFANLKSFFVPSSLFLWGIDPKTLGIKAEKYQPVLFDKVKVICVDSLPEIEANDELKKKLWGILKQNFLQ
jgi:hypothetical protein